MSGWRPATKGRRLLGVVVLFVSARYTPNFLRRDFLKKDQANGAVGLASGRATSIRHDQPKRGEPPDLVANGHLGPGGTGDG